MPTSVPMRSEAAFDGRGVRAKLIVDRDHYDDLVARRLREARVSVWISTANLKSTLVEAPIGSRARARGKFVSLYESLGDLAKNGVDVRLLHASAPSRPLAKEMGTGSKVQLRQCPRVHLKMIAIDGRLLYLGRANLTGAECAGCKVRRMCPKPLDQLVKATSLARSRRARRSPSSPR